MNESQVFFPEIVMREYLCERGFVSWHLNIRVREIPNEVVDVR